MRGLAVEARERVEKTVKKTSKITSLLLALILILSGLLPMTSQAQVTDIEEAGKIYGFMVTAVGNEISLSWEPTLAHGYEIYEAQEGQFHYVMTTQERHIVLTDKEVGKTYRYFIKPFVMQENQKVYGESSFIKETTVSSAKSTIKTMLSTGLGPMGHTLYIFGGGWRPNGGTGMSERIGVNPDWRQFFDSQDSSYNEKDYARQREKGLDCSGFVGFVAYNIMNTQNGGSRILTNAKYTGPHYSDLGLGDHFDSLGHQSFQAGDYMYNDGHAYIVIGQAEDGSVALMHSSPKGVKLGATPTPEGGWNSQARTLVTNYMETYFPEYYAIDNRLMVGLDYLTNYKKFTWSEDLVTDPHSYRDLPLDVILEDLFNSNFGKMPILSQTTYDQFPDIKESHWAYKFVLELCNKDIINGLPNGNFEPDGKVSREQVAKMIVMAKKLPYEGKQTNFADSQSSWANSYIAAAVEASILTGYPDKSFKPANPITRAEAATVITKAFGFKASGQSNFIDTKDHWAEKAIDALNNLGIINGYSDNSFKPNNPISRAEFSKMLSKALAI